MNEYSRFPTTERMLEDIEKTIPVERPRGYLGASSLGHKCDQNLWLDFRLAMRPTFPVTTHFKFDDGHYSEAITAERLLASEQIKLKIVDGDCRQLGAKKFGGHLAGHMDGLIKGVVQFPDEEMVWEHKCTEHKSFVSLKNLILKGKEKNPLQKWNYTYYVQAQIYMDLFKLKKHFLTVAIAGSREYIELITEPDKECLEDTYERAKNIIANDIPQQMVSSNGDKYPCNYCNNKPICFDKKIPKPNCRLCVYASANLEAKDNRNWHCHKHGIALSYEAQIKGCNSHLYKPSVFHPWAVQIDSGADYITYETRDNFNQFINGPRSNMYTSQVLFNEIKTGDNV